MGSLTTLLARWSQLGRPIAVREMFDLARQHRFDGSVTVHFRGGVPRAIEAGRPTQVDVKLEADGDPLDTAGNSSHTPAMRHG